MDTPPSLDEGARFHDPTLAERNGDASPGSLELHDPRSHTVLHVDGYPPPFFARARLSGGTQPT